MKLLKKQEDELWRLCTDEEIEDMIRDRLMEMLDNYDTLNADDLAYKAWENENANGVVFCSNYAADQFVMRHQKWVDDALGCCEFHFGDSGHYAKMKAECNDKFLVVAFIQATEYYLYNQLEIGNNGGLLTEEYKSELRKKFEEVDYDGSF
jgi:hypothetical protein